MLPDTSMASMIVARREARVSTAEGRAAVYVVGLGSLIEVLSKSWFSVFQGYERLDLVSAMLIVQRFSTAAVEHAQCDRFRLRGAHRQEEIAGRVGDNEIHAALFLGVGKRLGD